MSSRDVYEDDFTQSARTSVSRRSVSRQKHQTNTERSIYIESRNQSVNHNQSQINESQFINHEQVLNDSSQPNAIPQGLTSKQLKAKLIEAVKNKGILNTMKSQLRNKLALELNSNIEQTSNKHSSVTISQKSRSNLALNTINCLLINHLKSNEYDYTLSVFMPECGINLNEVFY